MSLLYDPEAFSDIPKQDYKRLTNKAEWLWVHRKEIIHHPLSANLSGYFKRTVGTYRIIYDYDKEKDDIGFPIGGCIVIRVVGLRDTIYEIAGKKLG
jgi:mRNA-degrading endonuclease RelE of RelBE toxin-antitoxin system